MSAEEGAGEAEEGPEFGTTLLKETMVFGTFR
jgi:hypothetical protein